MKGNEYKVCPHCVMDTSDKNLVFDENGVCDRCNEFEQRIKKWWNYGEGHEAELKAILDEVKKAGAGKEYDCILGLSGGLDSSYMLHLAVTEWGLRPFVFHVDAGWNLPVAEKNIRKICDKLGDVHSIVGTSNVVSMVLDFHHFIADSRWLYYQTKIVWRYTGCFPIAYFNCHCSGRKNVWCDWNFACNSGICYFGLHIQGDFMAKTFGLERERFSGIDLEIH